MDELAIVRAELARLEEDERKLVQQLSDIRAAASAQRKRLDELIRTRGPLIERLPVEILLTILHFALLGPDPSQKETLACVSRRWRDVILDQPSFWSRISIYSRQSLDRAREHLEKSREAPLDIIIHGWLFDSYDTIREGLDLLVPHANRWHSLSVHSWTDMPRPVLQFILDHIDAIEFPSLRCVKLSMSAYTCFTLLPPTNTPILEHSGFGNNHPSLHSMPGTSLSKHIPVLTLISLSLSGDMLPCPLQPDSVHFPVLETLTISTGDTATLFRAIVTPKLKFLHYITSRSVSRLSAVFGSLRDKFSSVSQLTFSIGTSGLDGLDASAFCKAFPHVRHAKFCRSSPLSTFFGYSEGTSGSQSPVDYWKGLESVVFCGIHPGNWLEPPAQESNACMEWLVARQDRQPLRVRIEDVDVTEEDIESLYMLCKILQENCIVELDGVLWLESRLKKTADSHIQVVSSFLSSAAHSLTMRTQHMQMSTIGLMDDVGNVVGTNIGKSG
ncbi:hypothetical protein F5141DRAFT_1210419 [Pisolithus sp. B1]|nr:hypothetical protein F5141DRAFT_1210419 [Pisolithus sp. B1]